MLVHGDDGSEGEGVDCVDHDGVGRPVPLERLVRPDAGDLCLTHPGLAELSLHLLQGNRRTGYTI